MSGEPAESRPEDAFSLIGNEVRAAIVRTLAAPEDEGPWKELPFSELHERVDPDLDTGQFNYHLQKLVGHYVRSTEDGYQISPAGVTLYRTMVAGTFTREAAIDPFDAGFDCHFCGARVQGSYGDDQIEVRCSGCGHVYASNIIPPSVVEEGEAILDRVDTVTRHEMQIAADRVCPNCLNRLDATIIPAGESAFHDGEDLDLLAALQCDYCGATRYMTIGTALLRESRLRTFAADHEIDVSVVPLWELEFASTDRHLTIQSRDPWKVTFSLTLGDETLELVVDGDLEVVEERVEPA